MLECLFVVYFYCSADSDPRYVDVAAWEGDGSGDAFVVYALRRDSGEF